MIFADTHDTHDTHEFCSVTTRTIKDIGISRVLYMQVADEERNAKPLPYD